MLINLTVPSLLTKSVCQYPLFYLFAENLWTTTKTCLRKGNNPKALQPTSTCGWDTLYLRNTWLKYWIISFRIAGKQALILKGCKTLNSRLCFCLHFKPRDDVVVSILVQGKSLFRSKMLCCLYISVGAAPLFGSKEWFPLYQNQNNNKTQGSKRSFKTFMFKNKFGPLKFQKVL